MKMTRTQYLDKREFFRLKAMSAISRGDEMEAEYATGVVRGLDLAFGDGSAKSILDK